MRRFRHLAAALAVTVLLTSTPACYTVVGLGKDVMAVGRFTGKLFGGGKKDKDKKKEEKKEKKRN